MRDNAAAGTSGSESRPVRVVALIVMATMQMDASMVAARVAGRRGSSGSGVRLVCVEQALAQGAERRLHLRSRFSVGQGGRGEIDER